MRLAACGILGSVKPSHTQFAKELIHTMVKYIDYLVGRQSGVYAAVFSPDTEDSYHDHILDICTEEM